MTKALLCALNPEVAAQPYLLTGQMLRVMTGTGRRYAVPPGETVQETAERFGLSEERLRESNPEISKVKDWGGCCIQIPQAGGNHRKDGGEYGYRELIRDIQRLKARYSCVESGEIGTSVMGKTLPCANRARPPPYSCQCIGSRQ